VPTYLFRTALSFAMCAGVLLTGCDPTGDKPGDGGTESRPRDASGDAGTDAQTEDECASMRSELDALDGPRACAQPSDCLLVGAYTVGPDCSEDPQCTMGDWEASGNRGVFVSKSDVTRANELLDALRARCRLGLECAVDGTTFVPDCVDGTCHARPVSCNAAHGSP